MKTIVLSILLSLATGNTANQNITVYISTGCSAYAYHAKRSCRTLKRCNQEGHVQSVSMEKANSMGRKPCKVCIK